MDKEGREAAVVDALCEYARPIILTAWRPDSCIASTRIGIDVLEYFGVPATPLPVKTRVINPAAVKWVDGGGDMALLGENVCPDAWIVDIGFPPEIEFAPPPGRAPGSYWGHLAIRTPHHLVDLSLDQAARPHKGIVIGASAFEMHVVEPTFYRHGDLVVGYWPLADDRRYLTTPDWTKYRRVQRALAGRIIRAVRKSL